MQKPLDIRQYSTEEIRTFFSLRYLRSFVGERGLELPKTIPAEVIAERCLEHLTRQLYAGGGADAFDRQRGQESLRKMLEATDGLAAKAAAVKFIAIDVTDWVDKNYDFGTSAFPLNREKNGPLSDPTGAIGSLFNIVPFENKMFPVESSIAEKWVKNRGRMVAICEVGKLSPIPSDIMLSLKGKCLCLLLLGGDGHPLAEMQNIQQVVSPVAPKLFDIHKDIFD